MKAVRRVNKPSDRLREAPAFLTTDGAHLDDALLAQYDQHYKPMAAQRPDLLKLVASMTLPEPSSSSAPLCPFPLRCSRLDARN